MAGAGPVLDLECHTTYVGHSEGLKNVNLIADRNLGICIRVGGSLCSYGVGTMHGFGAVLAGNQ